MDRGKCVSVMKGKFGKVKKYVILLENNKIIDCLPIYLINQINNGELEVSNINIKKNKIVILGKVKVIKIDR